MKKVIVSVVAALVLAGGLFSIKAYASFNNGMCSSFREYPEEQRDCIEDEGSSCTFHYEYVEGDYTHSGYATVPNKRRIVPDNN